MKKTQVWMFVLLGAIALGLAGCNSEDSGGSPQEEIAKHNKNLPPSDPNPPPPPVREDGKGGLGGGKRGP